MYISEREYLIHYGVKGMRWGFRKDPERSARRAEAKRQRKLKKAQKKWDKNVARNKYKAYNNAARYANSVLIPKINKKYTPEMLKNPATRAKYEREYQQKFNAIYKKEYNKMFGKRPA